MKIDLEFLKLKKEILVLEAEKYLDIQNKTSFEDHSYLVKALTNEPDFIKGNLPFCFVQRCIKNTDDIFALTHADKDQNYKCDIKFDVDLVKMWQTMDRKYKKVKPERGDIVIGYYVKNNTMMMNGFVGIVRSVDANLNLEIIEATVVNNYDEEPRSAQFDGIKVRIRGLNTKGKCRILGVFNPWFF